MKKTALTILAALALVPCLSLATEPSPYAGDELGAISSLTAEEIESLRSGGGMGFAKLAELNHYPGPRHVLDMVDDLDLTPSQTSATEALFEEMQRSAMVLGEELIDAEIALDQEFSIGAISSESLQMALLQIGKIRAQLRYVHLDAHLRQQRLLTAEQIAKYDEIRGYRDMTNKHTEHSKTH